MSDPSSLPPLSLPPPPSPSPSTPTNTPTLHDNDGVATGREGMDRGTDQAGAESTQNVRRMLGKLRTRWAEHAPSKPMYLEGDLQDGITISQFCTNFILSQRFRRVVRTSRDPHAKETDEAGIRSSTPEEMRGPPASVPLIGCTDIGQLPPFEP